MADRRLYLRFCWLPAVLWAGSLFALRGYDGWGAWAAAPLLLPAIILSLLQGASGLIVVAWIMLQEKRLDVMLAAASLMAAGPILYYLIKHVLKS